MIKTFVEKIGVGTQSDMLLLPEICGCTLLKYKHSIGRAMAILNWITYRICEEATEEYKSGKARGLKVTLTSKHNYDLYFSLIYYPVGLLGWRA